MIEVMSPSDQLFLGLAVALMPLLLAYFGWVAWREKARVWILEGGLMLPWQRPYTERRYLEASLDVAVVVLSLGLMVIGFWSQAWMQDLAAMLIAALAYAMALIGAILAVARMMNRSNRPLKNSGASMA
ncbi:MAG: hypothetical protein ACOY58_01240 [Candidatus Micrarchaeota archaeon]